MTAIAPDMTDHYRRLLAQVATKFGGEIDDTNADAIAFAAAELYRRDYEPPIWQEKSAHELLDMLGVPRAGVFAPHSLSERLLALQRRTSQATYVTKAHELLTALGVPRHDERGVDQPVRWRLEQLLAGAPAAEPEEAPETATEVRPTEPDVDDAAGAAPLADAPRALEQAAGLEAALTQIGPTPDVPVDVDPVRVNESLNGIFAELAALRAMVESLGSDLRARLELVHEEVLVATRVPRPDRNAVAGAESTQDVPIAEPVAEPVTEPVNGVARRSLRRLLLVVLLLVLGLLLAGTIILIGVYGWEQVRREVTGFLS